MSFSNSPQQPPPPPSAYMQLPFVGGDGGGFWPQFPLNHEFADHVPPFKRPRNLDGNVHTSTTHSSLNSRTNPPNLQGGKGTINIFYKTRMCQKFTEGVCRNGEHCTFAHGPEDLRDPPPNWQEIVREKDRGSGSWNDDQRIINKMKVCRKFYNGEECPYGERCNFLHNRPPKNDNERESSAISIGTTGSMPNRRGDPEQPEINKHVNAETDAFRVKPVFWKTRLCSKFEITGHCPFGERCHFAHGQTELQASNVRAEAEVTPNSGPIPIKPVSVPIADPAPAVAVVSTLVDDKKNSKWKLTKKINRIYADWIDDLVPYPGSPTRREA